MKQQHLHSNNILIRKREREIETERKNEGERGRERERERYVSGPQKFTHGRTAKNTASLQTWNNLVVVIAVAT